MSIVTAAASTGIEDLDPDGVLAGLVEAETAERMAGRAKLELALRWCVLHPATGESGAAVWGDAGLSGFEDCEESLGGRGCPGIAAFAPEPFATALGVSTLTGMQLLADALDLSYRLPRSWERVRRLEVAPWRARRLAQATHCLSREAADWVDGRVASRIDSCGVVLIDRLIAHATATFDPQSQAEAEQAGKSAWDVRLLHRADGGWAGTSHLDATGDTVDLTRFYDLVCDHAAHLARLGDSDPLGARKAKALGVIADAQSHLDLYRTAAQAEAEQVERVEVRVRRPSLAKTRLYLHLDLTDLLHLPDGLATAGVGEVERLGPATTARIREWLGSTRATIVPVLHVGHDPPTTPPTTPPTSPRSTSTTRPTPSARRWSCVTGTASSPGAASRPGPATWTTSSRTCPPTTADRPVRPQPRSWPACAGDTTGPRPADDGDINATATAPTPGTAPTT